MVPSNTEVFCAVYNYAGKADLSKGYWNPKRKLEVTTHFFRDNQAALILKRKALKYISIGMAFFPKLKLNYTREMYGYV